MSHGTDRIVHRGPVPSKFLCRSLVVVVMEHHLANRGIELVRIGGDDPNAACWDGIGIFYCWHRQQFDPNVFNAGRRR